MDMWTLCQPIHKYFRKRRMNAFWRHFTLDEDASVLDVGGTDYNWSLLPRRPRLVLLNLRFGRRSRAGDAGDAQCVVADACHLPFIDGAFSVVYSNSVIEHLGCPERQQSFAAECTRVGRRYYVQTPNRRFPIEPHFMAPFVHWLPPRLQRRLVRNCTLWGIVMRPTQQQCDGLLAELCLLSGHDLKRLFPGAEIWRERVLGLTKSFVAVRSRTR